MRHIPPISPFLLIAALPKRLCTASAVILSEAKNLISQLVAEHSVRKLLWKSLMIVILTSCAAPERIFLGPPKVLTVEEVQEEVTANSLKITSLKAKAKITLMSRELKDPLVCTGHIRLERPKRLRIICSKMFRTIFNVMSDGREFWLHVPGEKRLYHGLSNQDITYLGLKFSPNDVAGILEIEEVFKDTAVTSFEVHPEHWHIELINPLKLTEHHLVIERRTLHVIRFDSFNPDGSLRMKALLGDYRNINGCHVPQRIEVYWPRGDTRLILQLKGLRLNEELDPKIFRFTPPPNVEIIHLSKRRKPSYLKVGRHYTYTADTVNKYTESTRSRSCPGNCPLGVSRRTLYMFLSGITPPLHVMIIHPSALPGASSNAPECARQ